ncbi:unnamed protein product [Fraxinus pennsylvanica]|uniref:Cysteine-rich receptor-like protein kinase 2 n=1 Tax=Fraxinus pennsylvanica TaxID=56036 RepID=A0AAD1Z3P3_9LAMI|nr:unnamed protein product [Fraxinus pennsylvanica]
MKKFIASPIVIIIILVNLLLPDASLGEPRDQMVDLMCGNQPPTNSTISVGNFVLTMENISVQMRTSGFGVAVTGSGPNINYGLAQCYGDLSLLDCFLCYAYARSILPRCDPVNSGRVYLDGCFMRAENYSFYQEYTGPYDRTICGNRTQKNSAFQVSARKAVAQAVSAAPNNNGYARDQVPVSGTANESAYVLANCWRTLSASSCSACLQNASASILGCLPRSEGRALNTGCFVRYSDINFLNPMPGNGIPRGTITVVVVAAVSSVGVLVIGAVIGVYIWKHRTIQKKRKGSSDAEKLAKTLHHNSLNFKYSTLEKATSSFDEANKLGQGGYGAVYKGVLRDGREIAVKRLYFNNKHRAADFYNEVNIISSVEHKNLVRLLGCSCSGPESLLVYEFLPNKSLDSFIFDPIKGKSLNWEKRFEIIIGTTEGLRAKIADFGLARSFPEGKSHISTAIAGTLGYMAPEYLANGQLTEKVDVYSFGVLLLEIVTARQNNNSRAFENSDSLATLVWKHFQQRTVDELFDPNIILHNCHNFDVKNEILRVVHVGLLCTQEIPSLRPSMSRALQMLVKKEEHLPAPTNPPFMNEMTMELNNVPENPSSHSIASISHSIFYPR